jgi:methionyl aminopeptidase
MDSEIIEKYKAAGKIASEVREYAKMIVKPGMKLIDIANLIEDKIIELNGVVAFPVNLSLDEVAAHYTPLVDDERLAEGLLKIDIGVCVDGYIGDTAVTLDLTEDKRYSEMIELNTKLLNSAKKIINPNLEVRDIGEEITNNLDEFNLKNESNYTIVVSLTGHGLDKNQIHASPNIPNYANSISRRLNGSAFAVEPFVTEGSGDIYEGSPGGIYILRNEKGQVRDRDAREILKFILANYETRPFCERWLVREGFKKIKFSLSQLTRQGIIYQYPLLVEKTKSPVSQMEHSFLIDGDSCFCLTE